MPWIHVSMHPLRQLDGSGSHEVVLESRLLLKFMSELARRVEFGAWSCAWPNSAPLAVGELGLSLEATVDFTSY